MKNKIATVILGFLVGSITFPFEDFLESFLGLNVYLLLAIGALVSSLGLQIWTKKQILPQTLFLWGGAEAAILLRALFDLIFVDEDSHNLLGLEIILTSIYVFPAALAGATLGWLFRHKV